MAAQRHLIKKYANRKLYDTEASRYITLEGISRLVREGHDIQVIDRDSGRDLTPLILSQIVMGEEKRGGQENGEAAVPDRRQALIDYVRRTLSAPAALVSGEVGRRRADLEELVDLVERVVARYSVPTRRDVNALSAKIEQLERRMDLVESDRDPTSPHRRTASDSQ